MSYSIVIKEVKQAIDLCRWASSSYWRCRIVESTRFNESPKKIVKVIYLSRCDYICFLFPQYSESSLPVFQAIPKDYRYFYSDTVNCWMTTRTWSVPSGLLLPLLERLKQLSSLIFEFVIWQSDQIPRPFQTLALTFEEKKPKERWFSPQSSLKS
ncbi:hypothetical protein [Aphanothece hegewaldii]|nr:hypothetical protein [Aphanothece hegewaldii]